MHRGVYVLALSVFALGTTEFMISGLLPGMAADLGVSVPAVGGLIATFAIGMLVGAPLMAVLTLRWPRKATLLGALAVFTAGHLVGALSTDYAMLVVVRVVTAVATGAFWAVGGVLAVTLGGEGRRARALAIMVGGLTVANVLGVPLGTFIGEHGGWRGAFVAVAVAAAVALLGVLLWVPKLEGAEGVRPDLRAELRAFRQPRIWVSLATTALTSAAIFGTFSYVSPLLTGLGGFPASAVPVLLAAFGLGGVIGIQVGGRFADGFPFGSLLLPLAALVLVLVVMALFARSEVVLVGGLVLFGFAGFGTNPALNARVFGLAGGAPTLASSVNVSAFNTGNTLGPLIGGAVIGAGLGYPMVLLTGAVLAVLAAGAGLVSARLDRRAAGSAPQAGDAGARDDVCVVG